MKNKMKILLTSVASVLVAGSMVAGIVAKKRDNEKKRASKK
ncbi:hypothetical protein [Fructilactobacillus fructivorans]|uniref:Uncharacterized protein n=1 Tax=Fructilactobacillus fructivorans TaxID=1614 RepID=A0A0C1LX23_9LACO|nr:hypothetical protein [Fructilactobacillus fructivorans]KID41165.1 hypothetical protein LfDm3_1311 [Fructilactobacillus fructivorans]